MTLKKLQHVALVLLFAICISCIEENSSDDEDVNGNGENQQISSKEDQYFLDLGKAFAKSLSQNQSLRTLVKSEALKMFDRDYDILYSVIKDVPLEDGKTVRELLKENYHGRYAFDIVERAMPLLTIFVPELPENSFSAMNWDVTSQIPKVAVNMSTSSAIMIIDPTGKTKNMDRRFIPAFPVVVIKENERVVVKEQSLKTSGRSFKGGDIEFQFIDPAFDKMKSHSNARVVTTIDSKLVQAYDIYKGTDGWQRDYIYYNISPTQTRGPFIYDFKEFFKEFRLNGDPNTIYGKIQDQNDPELTPKTALRKQSGGFTDGEFEFRFSVLYNAKNGLGQYKYTYLPVSPYNLFTLTYTKQYFAWGIYYYFAKISELKTVPMNEELLNWDLLNYAPTLLVEVEEVDTNETITETQTIQGEFLSNFEVNLNVFEKVGLKTGGSLKTTSINTYTKTYSLGSDPLGSVIINFADNVIVGKTVTTTGTTYTLREYVNTNFVLSVEPVRVQ
jgi:hypothetical protein